MTVSHSSVEVFSLLHGVLFIVSQSRLVLPETGLASTGMSHESWGFQGHNKCHTFYQTVDCCIRSTTAC